MDVEKPATQSPVEQPLCEQSRRAEAARVKTDGLPRRFFTVANAAAYTDLSIESIRRLICSGKLTALRPVRGRILVDRQELEALVRASTAPTRTGRGKRSRT